MEKNTIIPDNIPEPIGPYSVAVKFGDMIFTSGQLGIDPKTGILAQGVEEQTKQSLTNLKTILKSYGSNMDKVLKTTVFLNDINDFEKMNEVYGTFFSRSYPARSAIEVARLPKGALVEIEVIAAQ